MNEITIKNDGKEYNIQNEDALKILELVFELIGEEV